MIVKLLTEYHLEFLSLKGGCRGSSESTLVKMSNCWKSHAAAHMCFCKLKHCFWQSETQFCLKKCTQGRRLPGESPLNGGRHNK